MNIQTIISNKEEQFWADDPGELYKNYKFLVIVPTKNMTKIQQLNALTRLILYIMVLCLLLSEAGLFIIVGIMILVFITLAHRLFYNDYFPVPKNQNNIKNTESTKSENIEGFTDLHKIQSGYYDSDNNLILGYRQPPYLKLPHSENAYNVYDLIDCDKNMCRRPTPNNPFMNPGLLEFGTENPPVACNVNDEEIKEDIKVNYDHMLFRDVSDVWERQNSQRNFFTLPNTAIPNNQTEFAKWLYWIPGFANCKESGNCLRYDSLVPVSSEPRRH